MLNYNPPNAQVPKDPASLKDTNNTPKDIATLRCSLWRRQALCCVLSDCPSFAMRPRPSSEGRRALVGASSAQEAH
eukprot:5549651-Alexandrium_andersonii.AAC.1